jgi:hypothetical protein
MGGRDRKDGTDIAGSWMKVHHNTFGSPETALVVRGMPDEETTIQNNWFYHASDEQAVRAEGNIRFVHNAYGYRSQE